MKTIDTIALAKDLARNATNDELLVYAEYSELGNTESYQEEEDLFEEDGVTYKAEIQPVFNQWVEFYTRHINACEVKLADKIYLKLDDIDGSHISIIEAEKGKNTEAMAKIKMAFQEDRNCTVVDMTNFQVYEVLEGNVAAIQFKYFTEDGTEEESVNTTIYISQTWVY